MWCDTFNRFISISGIPPTFRINEPHLYFIYNFILYMVIAQNTHTKTRTSLYTLFPYHFIYLLTFCLFWCWWWVVEEEVCFYAEYSRRVTRMHFIYKSKVCLLRDLFWFLILNIVNARTNGFFLIDRRNRAQVTDYLRIWLFGVYRYLTVDQPESISRCWCSRKRISECEEWVGFRMIMEVVVDGIFVFM